MLSFFSLFVFGGHPEPPFLVVFCCIWGRHSRTCVSVFFFFLFSLVRSSATCSGAVVLLFFSFVCFAFVFFFFVVLLFCFVLHVLCFVVVVLWRIPEMDPEKSEDKKTHTHPHTHTHTHTHTQNIKLQKKNNNTLPGKPAPQDLHAGTWARTQSQTNPPPPQGPRPQGLQKPHWLVRAMQAVGVLAPRLGGRKSLDAMIFNLVIVTWPIDGLMLKTFPLRFDLIIHMGLGTLSGKLDEAGPLLWFTGWKSLLVFCCFYVCFRFFLLSHLHLLCFFIGLAHLHFLLHLFICSFLHFSIKYQVHLILQGSGSHKTRVCNLQQGFPWLQ